MDLYRLTQPCIGLAMRLYRASPLHPRLGPSLARILGRLNSGGRIAEKEVRGLFFELDLSEVIDASMYYSGSFEPEAERMLESLAGPGAVVVDVGANIGYHALPLARRVGSDGLVLAIEPTARAMDRLRRNAQRNELGNVRFLRIAMSDVNREEESLQFQSSYRLDGSARPELETVPLRTLDSVVLEQRLLRVDLIKVDVDGFEGRVLAGARETLARFRPALFFELCPGPLRDLGGDPEAVLASLIDLGYELRTEGGRPLQGPQGTLEWIGRRVGANVLALPGSKRPQ